MSKLQTRICRLCGEEKSLKVSFYKKKRGVNGYDTRCKECHCSLSRERLRRNYDKDREAQKWLKRKKDKRHIENERGMREKYPEKYKARYQLRNAVKTGKIQKGVCEKCGSAKTEGHHDDYSKPLEVRWFCQRHHKDEHLLQALKNN